MLYYQSGLRIFITNGKHMNTIQKLAGAFSSGSTALIFCPQQDIDLIRHELDNEVQGSQVGQYTTPTTEIANALNPFSFVAQGRTIFLIDEKNMTEFCGLFLAKTQTITQTISQT